MNKTLISTAKVVQEYRERKALTYRAFAEALNEHLVNTSVTHVTVMNWEKGMSDPRMEFLWIVLINHSDWRADWAVDMLCALLPEAFGQTRDKRLVVLSNRVVNRVSQAGQVV